MLYLLRQSTHVGSQWEGHLTNQRGGAYVGYCEYTYVFSACFCACLALCLLRRLKECEKYSYFWYCKCPRYSQERMDLSCECIIGPRGGSNHKSRPGGQNLILITNVSLPVYLSSYPAINAIFLAFSKSGPEIFFRSVVFWYPKRLRKST